MAVSEQDSALARGVRQDDLNRQVYVRGGVPYSYTDWYLDELGRLRPRYMINGRGEKIQVR